MSNSENSTMLEVQKLNKSFGEFRAVKDLDITIKKGEVFGFLGPNGAGKTTTMKMITCLIPQTSGTIKIAGMDSRSNDLEIKRKIGYLPENNPLYNDMLVSEYIQFVAEIRGLSGSLLKRKMDEMLNVCGLTNMTRRQIGKLSKGYRQRVGLAQAMVHDPDLLILDEPTSGLDPNQIVEIRQLIKNVGKEKTVIYCSHILTEVSATCDRILIINNGEKVATGTAEELTAKMNQGTHFSITIKGDSNDIESAISSVSGVEKCTCTNIDADGWVKVLVTTNDDNNIGEQLFKCVVDHKWSLSELKKESASLEEVFTQLTRG